MQDTHAKRRFVEPTLTEEASLTDVTLTSGGKGGRYSGRHGNGHGHGSEHHGGSSGGPHGGGRKH